MKFVILIAVAAGFIYTLMKKPEIISVVLFTFIIGRVNFDINGLPLNSRAIISLALFGRILWDKSTNIKFSTFISVPYIKLVIFFLVYILFVSMSQDLFTLDLLKEMVSSVFATFFVFYFYLKNNNADHLKVALIASGLICFADLTYTYVAYGSFPIHRVIDQFTGKDEASSLEEMLSGINWNFFGQISGMCFVYLFSEILRNKNESKFTIWLLPVMILTVLMSTSRSTLLGMFVACFVLALGTLRNKEQKKRLAKIGRFFTVSTLVALLLLTSISKMINLDAKFLDEIVSRLADEPIAVVNKALGQPYNVYNLGSMDWREESAENAYTAFMNLPLNEQIFGIGSLGFEVRSLGHGYNAHNATLLLLIEYGMVGLFIYFLLVAGILYQAVIRNNLSGSFGVIVFIFFYGLGQNREWTSVTTLLFIVCIITELYSMSLYKQKKIMEGRLFQQSLAKASVNG